MMHSPFLLFAGIFLSILAATPPNWQLVKNNGGIKVYTADSETSAYKLIKTVSVFDGNQEKLISIFRDVDNQKKWVFGTRRSYLIKKINENELLYYVETALPWPAKNRDATIRMKIDNNNTDNILTITTVGEPDVIPVNKGIIRVPQIIGKWEIKMVGKDKISIDYFLDIDPGGALPAWIINLFITKGPYETFSNLAELLKE
jgi:hypothetical protein